MLKYEATADIGDIIKALDFKPCSGRADVFVEGLVIDKGDMPEVGCKAYKIKVTKDSEDAGEAPGEWSRVGEILYVPFEITLIEFDGRITVIEYWIDRFLNNENKIEYLTKEAINGY